MLKVDIPCITRTPLRNKWRSFKRKRKRYWMRYNIVIVKDFYPLYMSRLFTGHVLILAPFWVWVKLQCSTYTYSTVSWAPFLPKLPTLNEIFILVYLYTYSFKMIALVFFFFFLFSFFALILYSHIFVFCQLCKNKTKLYCKMRLSTNLIPWPGPQLIPVILIWAEFPLIAMQSSPIKIVLQAKTRKKTSHFHKMLEI